MRGHVVRTMLDVDMGPEVEWQQSVWLPFKKMGLVNGTGNISTTGLDWVVEMNSPGWALVHAISRQMW